MINSTSVVQTCEPKKTKLLRIEEVAKLTTLNLSSMFRTLLRSFWNRLTFPLPPPPNRNSRSQPT
jgi:predicted DNA-binding transcriptional regulator AlpA